MNPSLWGSLSYMWLIFPRDPSVAFIPALTFVLAFAVISVSMAPCLSVVLVGGRHWPGWSQTHLPTQPIWNFES